MDVDFTEHIYAIMADTGKIDNPFTAQLWLRERYDNDYQIYDHRIDQGFHNSLALVRDHWSEATKSTNLLASRREAFVEFAVNKYFGVSWAEFLNFPRSEVMEMLEISKRYREKELTAQTNASNLIDQMKP